MESLSEMMWDAVICGTGLQQSLLALALSRSDKKILHLDPNEYYGGPDAAFSLQEAEGWASEHASVASGGSSIFRAASVSKPEEEGLSSPRAYSLALSPQLIHTRSALLSQLVSSRAFRQVEFLAVGSFFIFKPASTPASDDVRDTQDAAPKLARIPSTREDIFSASAIPARAKRLLMKFLKFVLEYESDDQRRTWEQHADKPLGEFLRDEFKLGEADLQTYILTLTLALDYSKSTTRDGLAIIYRHLTSMGVLGPGFAAVYPKWGGSSEIAQVACRAGAVGGGVYMLGNGIKAVKKTAGAGSDGTKQEDGEVELELTSGVTVRTRLLFRGDETRVENGERISRLVAVVRSPLTSLFETVVEGAPTPAVAVVAFPPSSVKGNDGVESQHPIYVIAHSSDTGECPAKQSVLYLTTLATSTSKSLLEKSLCALLGAVRDEDRPPSCLYQLYYEQSRGSMGSQVHGPIFDFPTPPLGLSFDDATLEPVKQAWKMAMGNSAANAAEPGYMVFPDREGVGDDDDMYD